jgi:hypothetical protein
MIKNYFKDKTVLFTYLHFDIVPTFTHTPSPST